jgi:tRNA-2-methylthio-N6-dimethylallyladenosine synthase
MEKEIIEERQGEVMNIPSGSVGKKLFLESYGCAMNFADSEIVASILQDAGYVTTQDDSQADVVLLNTCSIRDNAEVRVRKRIEYFNSIKRHKPGMVIGILGCMAERLKSQLLEEDKVVDLVVGPDAYRDLPSLVGQAEDGTRAVNVLLSREETYADVSPIRLNSNGVTAYISIMRGCDNMCSFCVVPFTRGRERSRDPETIVHEAKYLFEQGYREVTLLGQNVDSYRWNLTRDEKKVDAEKAAADFADLLSMVAEVDPLLRVRFSTSHPKDMSDKVLRVMASQENICDYVHLPVQSGNTEVLKRMNRGYSREWYLDRIKAIKTHLPSAGISTDIITGFCGESEDDHKDTLSLLKEVKFHFAYMYTYSERPKTLAERKFEDDIPEETKKRRLAEIIRLQREHSQELNQAMVGETCKVLIEGESKRSTEQFYGRNTENMVVVFDREEYSAGEYVDVHITDCTGGTLIGTIVK